MNEAFTVIYNCLSIGTWFRINTHGNINNITSAVNLNCLSYGYLFTNFGYNVINAILMKFTIFMI